MEVKGQLAAGGRADGTLSAAFRTAALVSILPILPILWTSGFT